MDTAFLMVKNAFLEKMNCKIIFYFIVLFKQIFFHININTLSGLQMVN